MIDWLTELLTIWLTDRLTILYFPPSLWNLDPGSDRVNPYGRGQDPVLLIPHEQRGNHLIFDIDPYFYAQSY